MMPASSSCGTITSGLNCNGLKFGAGEGTTQTEPDTQDGALTIAIANTHTGLPVVKAKEPERHNAGQRGLAPPRRSRTRSVAGEQIKPA